RWLIEHHPEATELREGTLGMRSRRRLQADESYEELMLLADCDRRGRMRGMAVPDVEDALAYIQEIARACDEDE
ncbi:MAG: tRNA adenylyltransferase, partial [Pirellulaceae bacterium]